MIDPKTLNLNSLPSVPLERRNELPQIACIYLALDRNKVVQYVGKIGEQFMLTETASSAIDAVAKELEISRSEVVERAARCGGMQAARQYKD